MAMVPALAGGGALDNPFQRRDVAEWSRLDRLTGMLERTRVETDQWAVSRGSHTGNYNKVVNSRARNAADGSLQQRQKKQLEVFQAQGPGGSLQVIRTQSITSTSSGKASSWLPSSSPAFENLQLTLNPLDLSSQKTKASVGRSGSIGSRRPPSRPRSLVDRAINEEETDNRLSEVSRVCQQIHDDAKKRHGLEDFELEVTPHRIEPPHEDSDDSGSFRRSISERRSFRSSTSKSNSASSFNGFPHETVNRNKSSSTEDLQEEVDEWRRSSKVRRSLQLSPRSSVAAEDLPPKGSVQKLKQELEGRRRFDLKNLRGHEAFENVLKRGEDIINSEALGFSVGEKHSDSSSKKSSLPGSKRHSFVTVESLKEVRERLRRTGSPLGDTNKESEEPDDGIVTEEFQRVENEEKMEDVPVSRVKSYVYGMETQTKSNREIIRKPPQGTGSLESRTSNRSSSSGGSRTEEWYNRRKSYGFEQVHGGQTPEQPSLTNFREKNRVESSTDSGICRSTEAVSLPPWHRASPPKGKSDDLVAKHRQESHKINHSSLNGIPATDDKTFEGRKTVVTLGMETAKPDDVLFISEPVTEKIRNDCNAGLKKTTDGSKGVQALIDNLMARENRRMSQPVTITIPVTTEENTKEKGIVDNKRQYFQQLSSGGNYRNWKRTPVALNGHEGGLKIKQWKDGEVSHHTECEMKRHSIAVDESKYVRDSISKYDIENGYSSGVEQSVVKSLTSRSSPDFAKQRANLNFASSWSREPIGPGIRVSFTNNTAENKVTEEDDDSDQTLMGKKTKRVEFCKTEVHFAAEPGRFNIVETDEKPPPTNMFRRRRRSNPIPDQSKSGLPEIRFGDSLYEKSLLTGTDVTEQIHVPDVPRNIQSHREAFEENVEKEDSVFTESNATIFPPEDVEQFDQVHEDQDNLMSADNLPRGILKNNRKPRPFHLGEEGDILTNEEHNSSGKWGMPLRSSQDKDEESQVPWRSSVILRQSVDTLGTEETELQKLLKSLRPATQRRTGDETQDKKSGSEVKVSVADRIRQVEGKGYSTKVNFGVGEATVVEEPVEDKERSKPSWLYKEDSIGQDAATNMNINRPHQVSVATAVLPSYSDSDRLRLVETLVSTRSGRPKITSISLRYDSDQPTSQSNRHDSIKLESSSQCTEAIPQSPRCQDAFMQTDIPTENQSTQNKSEKLYSSSSVFSENVYMGHPKTIKLSSVKKFSSPQPAKSHLATEEKRSSLPRNTKNDQRLFSPQTPEFLSTSTRQYENVPLPFVEHKDNESDHDYEEIMPLPVSQAPVTMTKALESCSSNTYSRGDKRVSVTKSSHSSSRRISPCREGCDAIKPIRSSSTSRTSSTTVHQSGLDRKRSPSPLPSSQRQSQRSSSVQRNDDRKSYWAKEERQVRHRSTSRGRHEAKKTPSEQLLEEEMLASESRVYQSAEACRQISAGKDTETNILEELTRAADQILQAVNGYTDEESRRASSDDDENDFRRKRGKKVGQVRRPSAVLGTISEGQAIKKKPEARVRPEPVRTRTSRLGPTSSTSSVESFTKEIRKASTAQARSLLKKEKANSLEGRGRTARLLQRATSREMLLSHGSSSEDITAGENAIRRQRVPRKSRTAPTTGSATSKKENTTQQSVKGRKEPTESSRTREKSSAVTKPTGQATRKPADINSSSTRAISSRLHSSRSREEVPRRGRTTTHGVPSMRSAARERSDRREVESRHMERTCGVAEKKKTASDSGSGGKPKSKTLKY